MVDVWGTCSIPPAREHVQRLEREWKSNDVWQKIINKGKENVVNKLAHHTSTA